MDAREEISTEHLIESAETVYKFAQAVIVGSTQGVMHAVIGLANAVIHPIDNVFYPVGSFLYDAAVISAGHINNNTVHVGNPLFPEADLFRQAIQDDPQIYHDAMKRMDDHVHHIRQAGQDFVNASWDEQVRMASVAISSFATNIYAPGLVVNSIKAIVNMQKYGIPYNPPSFHYWMPRRDGINRAPLYTPEMIMTMPNVRIYLYAVMENNALIITPKWVIQEKNIQLNTGKFVKRVERVEVKHSELTGYDTVLVAGEMTVKDGKIISLDNNSGRYRAHGKHLPGLVDGTFEQNGFPGVAGKFKDEHRGKSDSLTIKVPNKMDKLPDNGVIGAVNMLAEGLKQPEGDNQRRQQERSLSNSGLTKNNNENFSEKYSQNNNGGSSNTNHQKNVAGYEHGTGVYERVGVNFDFNGQHYSMEMGIGLEINVGTENNAVVATDCRNGYCNITLRAGNDRYVNLNTPYHHINNSNSRNNKDAGVERLKNDLNILSKTNHSSGVSDNSIFSGSNSTSRMMDSLRSLNDSQHDFNRSLTTSRVDNFSQFTNQSRETYYFSSANEAERYSSFFSNYISGNFRQTPPPERNNYSFFGRWGGSNGGKSEYCDAFGNCYSSGGGNNCHDSGSSRCESSIKF